MSEFRDVQLQLPRPSQPVDLLTPGLCFTSGREAPTGEHYIWHGGLTIRDSSDKDPYFALSRINSDLLLWATEGDFTFVNEERD